MAPTPQQEGALTLLWEQSAVQVDHLGRFLGVDYEVAEQIAATLADLGWARFRQFLVGEGCWLWLTWSGARVAGHRGAVPRMQLRLLGHWRAVTEARLQLEARAPEGRWTGERELRRRQGFGHPGLVPDGIFEVDGERHAIEVEVSPRAAARRKRRLQGYGSRFDAIVHFCGPQALGPVTETVRSCGDSRMVVRPLPDGACSAAVPQRNRRLEPTAAELEALAVAAGDGAIRCDRLGRLLGWRAPQVEAIAASLRGAGLARLVSVGPGEAEWIWLTARGARLGNGPRPPRRLTAQIAAELGALQDARLREGGAL